MAWLGSMAVIPYIEVSYFRITKVLMLFESADGGFFLNLEELESIQKYEWLQIGILSMGSIAGFYFLGAELVGTFVLRWFVGALIGGLLSIEVSFRLRRQVI